VTGVGGDDLADLVGGAGEGVIGGVDVAKSLAGIGNYERGEGGSNGREGEAAEYGLGNGGPR